MHTIKANNSQGGEQIIHFNPDLSGQVIINVINPVENVEINGKAIATTKVSNIVISGEILKELFLKHKSDIFNCETCKSFQKENMFCTCFKIAKNVELNFGCFHYR